MNTPEGQVDLFGTGMQLGSELLSLIAQLSPTPEERKLNKAQRKLNVAIRRLKHKRFRHVPIAVYIKANFGELSDIEEANVIAYVKELLKRE